MSSSYADETPCFVQTKQGVSIEYRGRLLYSKYNPSKNIENLVQDLKILPGTILLCFSPVLKYGIQSLLDKLPQDCLLFLCEIDEILRPFINDYYKTDFSDAENVIFPSCDELYDLPILLNKKKYKFSDDKCIFSGSYRRIIRIDFSGGVQIHQNFYNQLESSSINAIKTFWINRVTLTKFGRKYSHNMFKNLSILPQSTPISFFFNSISKPIIVCGAGESLNYGINDFLENRECFFIIAVDTALNFLIKNEIVPDAVFIEETQNIILESFFEINNFSNCQVFASLSSIPVLSHNIIDKRRLSFFFTKYADNDFINDLTEKSFFPPENPPFGSVGLTSVYYALKFRQSDCIPIYIYGLDFSYSIGLTHVKNSISNKNRLINSNRITEIANYSSAFVSSEKISDALITNPSLKNYANLFNAFFSNKTNLFDSRNSGLCLNIPYKKPELTIKTDIDSVSVYKNKKNASLINLKLDTNDYFKNELKFLQKIKDILTNKDSNFLKKTQSEKEFYLTKMLEKREYLYLHFIDGFKLRLDSDFLKRIRSEIDSYEKDFKMILNFLDSE